MDFYSVNIAKDLEGFSRIEFTDAIACQETACRNWNKSFTLKPMEQEVDWVLPDQDALYKEVIWKDPFLQDLKAELNKSKESLGEIDFYEWNKHTYASNPAFRIKTVFQKNGDPEFMTNAFLKMYEILSRHDLLPEQTDKEFFSMHLCEAPGAFIVALNHYLSLNRLDLKKKWHWIGHSLNPYYEGSSDSECVNDDRFILHTANNWFFGSEYTGDILSSKFMRELRSHYGRKVDLVTADGSIDCQHDPGEQEIVTHRLHVAEALGAMLVLKQDGCFVMKLFTFFECESVNLLYLLCVAFAQVRVVKPVTSKWANSEVYIVAQGFRETSIQSVLPALIRQLDNPREMCVFPKSSLPETFVKNVHKCAQFFAGLQRTAICNNLTLFQKNAVDLERNSYLKTCVLRLFRDNVTMSKLDSDLKLVRGSMTPCIMISAIKDVVAGSTWLQKYDLRRKINFLRGQLDALQENLNQSCNKFRVLDGVEMTSSKLIDFQFIRGKPFNWANISRFCPKTVMSTFSFILGLRTSFGDDFNKRILREQQEKLKKTEEKVSNCYPESVAISDSNYRPSGSCPGFDDIVLLLETNKLNKHQNICLINPQLFTRLQVGMLLFIGSLFEKMILTLPQNGYCPYILFSNFNPIFKASLDEFRSLGWTPGGSNSGLLEIFPLKSIIAHESYKTVCLYNYSYCITNYNGLQQLLEDELE